MTNSPEAVMIYIPLMKDLAVEPPILIMVSLLDVKGFTITVPELYRSRHIDPTRFVPALHVH